MRGRLAALVCRSHWLSWAAAGAPRPAHVRVLKALDVASDAQLRRALGAALDAAPRLLPAVLEHCARGTLTIRRPWDGTAEDAARDRSLRGCAALGDLLKACGTQVCGFYDRGALPAPH